MTVERTPGSYSFEELTRIAKEVTLSYGYHIPTLVVQGDEEPVVVQIPSLPPTHEERLRMMFTAGSALAESGALTSLKEVFFISEGWMSVAAEDGLPEVPPSQDPQRREVLIVSGLEVNTGQAAMTIFEMLRDEDAKLVELAEIEQQGKGDTQVETPLLDAVVTGFQRTLRGRFN